MLHQTLLINQNSTLQKKVPAIIIFNNVEDLLYTERRTLAFGNSLMFLRARILHVLWRGCIGDYLFGPSENSLLLHGEIFFPENVILAESRLQTGSYHFTLKKKVKLILTQNGVATCKFFLLKVMNN